MSTVKPRHNLFPNGFAASNKIYSRLRYETNKRHGGMGRGVESGFISDLRSERGRVLISHNGWKRECHVNTRPLVPRESRRKRALGEIAGSKM